MRQTAILAGDRVSAPPTSQLTIAKMAVRVKSPLGLWEGGNACNRLPALILQRFGPLARRVGTLFASAGDGAPRSDPPA